MSVCGAKFSSYSSTIPRVVDAKIKPGRIVNPESWTEKSRISGDLYIVESYNLHLRYAEVRDGHLLLYRYVDQSKKFDIRIPLYNLSINLDDLKQNGRFSLTKYSDLTPLATFQVVNQGDCEQWVKTLAVEIIRQTPLNTLKFLDILFVDDILQKAEQHSTRSPCFKKSLINNPHCSHSLPKFGSSKANACDSDSNRMSRSIDSFDSGFHSLPPVNNRSHSPPSSHHKDAESKFFEDILPNCDTKSKSKLCRSDSIKASVSSSCLNLFHKFKKLNSSKENDLSRPSKIKYPKNDQAMKEQKSKCYEKRDSQVQNIEEPSSVKLFAPRRVSTRPKSLEGSSHSEKDTEVEEYGERTRGPQSNPKPSVAFKIPEQVLHNEELRVLICLLTKCQIDKEYVPVREKKLLFESSNRLSFSVDNLKRRPDFGNLTRSFSLNTLNENQISVKVMRDYFESLRNETPDKVAR